MLVASCCSRLDGLGLGLGEMVKRMMLGQKQALAGERVGGGDWRRGEGRSDWARGGGLLFDGWPAYARAEGTLEPKRGRCWLLLPFFFLPSITNSIKQHIR